MADQKPRQRRDLTLTPATSEDLNSVSEISSSDVARAMNAWDAVAPTELKQLPNAVVES